MAQQTKGEKMAQQLTDFINSANRSDEKDFVNAMMREHRTLQEDTFKLFLRTCEAWANMGASGHFDPRNQFTVLASTRITQLINNGL